MHAAVVQPVDGGQVPGVHILVTDPEPGGSWQGHQAAPGTNIYNSKVHEHDIFMIYVYLFYFVMIKKF